MNCPADVLVICPDKKTAAWYAQPVVTGMGASRFRARALFPDLVPAITVPDQAAADPRMAVLSVAYHGTDEKVFAGRARSPEEAQALLMIIEERGLTLSDKQAKLIADSADLNQLKAWSKAAITAKSSDDIFR